MRALSNNIGSVGYGEIHGKIGDFRNDIKNDAQVLINSANSVDILNIFKIYNIQIDQYNNIITCPFKQHSNGSERTASFNYYSNTNSFNCFGCNRGGGCCQFVSFMEGISLKEAASKIIETNSPSEYKILNNNDWEEKNKIKLFFSSKIRQFIKANSGDEEAIKYIEKICLSFDSINLKLNLNIRGLETLTNRLIEDIKKY